MQMASFEVLSIRHRREWVSIIALMTLLGCSGEREPPRNPAVMVMEVAPTEISNEHITECVILVNGQDLNDGVTVEQGSTVQIGGTMILDRSRLEGQHGGGTVHIRMQPAGSPEESWDGWEFSMEWVGPIQDEMDIEQLVGAPPGEYDARVFAVIFSLYETVPKFDLVGTGTVTVVPSTTE